MNMASHKYRRKSEISSFLREREKEEAAGQQVDCLNRMRQLLLATALLSTVSSEDFENKKRYTTMPDVEPNFWPARGRRSSWNDFGTDFGSNFENDENNPRRSSEPRFLLPDPQQSSPVAFIRYMERQPYLWSDVSDQPISPRHSWTSPSERRPSLLGSFDCYKYNDGTVVCERQRCSSRRGRRDSQRWRRQEPIYIEEPSWIEIDPNNDVSPGVLGSRDPFFVARGKKQSSPLIIDYRTKRPIANLIDSYSSNPFFITRGKRNVNDQPSSLIGNSEREAKLKDWSGSVLSKAKRKGSIVSLEEDSAVEFIPKKTGTLENGGFQTTREHDGDLFAAGRERSKSSETSEQSFSLSYNKKDAYEKVPDQSLPSSLTKNSGTIAKLKDFSRSVSSEIQIKRPMISSEENSTVELVSKKAESNEIGEFRRERELRNLPTGHSRSKPSKESSLPRDKRDAYEERSSDRFKSWQRNGSHGSSDQSQSSLLTQVKSRDDELKAAIMHQRQKIEEASKKPGYPHPRDKHSNFLDILKEPFFVSRGKKSSFHLSDNEEAKSVDDFEMEPPDEEGDHILGLTRNDAYVLRGRKLSDLLEKLDFMARGDDEAMKNNEDLEFFRNSKPYHVIRSKKTQQKPPRSRRGMLDELLRTNDPFFVSRGKRFDNDKSDFFPKYFDGNGVNSKNDDAVLVVTKAKDTRPVQLPPGLSKLESMAFGSRRQVKDLDRDGYNERDRIEQSNVQSVFSQKSGTYDSDVKKYIADVVGKGQLNANGGLN